MTPSFFDIANYFFLAGAFFAGAFLAGAAFLGAAFLAGAAFLGAAFLAGAAFFGAAFLAGAAFATGFATTLTTGFGAGSSLRAPEITSFSAFAGRKRTFLLALI